MAIQKSSDATIEISSDGISYTAISQVESHDTDKAATNVMINNYDQTSEQPRHGLDSFTFSFAYVKDETDSGQDLIETARAGQAAGTYYYLRIRENSGSGNEEILGQVLIESNRQTGRAGDYNRMTCAGRWITAPTVQNQ